MQNLWFPCKTLVSCRTTQGLYKLLISSRMHIAGNLDIPKELLVFPPRGSPNAGNHWNLGKFSYIPLKYVDFCDFLENPVKCIPGCFLKIPGSSWLQKPWKPLGIIAIFACWHKGKRFAKIMEFSGNHWISWDLVISMDFYENTESTGIQNNWHLQETFIIQSKFRCFWSAGVPGCGNHINPWEIVNPTKLCWNLDYFVELHWTPIFLCFWRALAAPGWKHQYFLRNINGLERSWRP